MRLEELQQVRHAFTDVVSPCRLHFGTVAIAIEYTQGINATFVRPVYVKLTVANHQYTAQVIDFQFSQCMAHDVSLRIAHALIIASIDAIKQWREIGEELARHEISLTLHLAGSQTNAIATLAYLAQSVKHTLIGNLLKYAFAEIALAIDLYGTLRVRFVKSVEVAERVLQRWSHESTERMPVGHTDAESGESMLRTTHNAFAAVNERSVKIKKKRAICFLRKVHTFRV